MKVKIRNYTDQDIEAIVDLSIQAWAPVFDSFQKVLGPQIYPLLYPDWRESQAQAVAQICQDQENYHTLVSETGGKVVGFLVYTLNQENHHGEVLLLAVHPDYQNDGIGTDLNIIALREMKAASMILAVVETGGEEGHAPARRSYEKAGYTPLPLVRYFKDL
jgi:ribosomal protein S18 acetylase RimI-like enzyme